MFGPSSTETIDLARYVEEIFAWPSDVMTALGTKVAQCDLLVIASPTYKAAYTGLLKGFLDRYPHNTLAEVTAIRIMTASDPVHGLAVEVTLRPLLVELGASVHTRGFCFLLSQMPEIDGVVHAWVAQNTPALRGLVGRAEQTSEDS